MTNNTSCTDEWIWLDFVLCFINDRPQQTQFTAAQLIQDLQNNCMHFIKGQWLPLHWPWSIEKRYVYKQGLSRAGHTAPNPGYSCDIIYQTADQKRKNKQDQSENCLDYWS